MIGDKADAKAYSLFLGITIMFAQTWGKKLNYYRVLNPRLILATLISLIAAGTNYI